MKKFFKFEVEEEEMKAGIQAVRDEKRRDETRRHAAALSSRLSIQVMTSTDHQSLLAAVCCLPFYALDL
jgi:hypothetical protein